MKLLRAVVVVLFLLGIEVYGAAWIGDRLNRDQTIPEITSDREMLEVPSAYTEDMLLEGLSAYDGLDGDLTDQIVVRGTVPFSGGEGHQPGVLCGVRLLQSVSHIHQAGAVYRL